MTIVTSTLEYSLCSYVWGLILVQSKSIVRLLLLFLLLLSPAQPSSPSARPTSPKLDSMAASTVDTVLATTAILNRGIKVTEGIFRFYETQQVPENSKEDIAKDFVQEMNGKLLKALEKLNAQTFQVDTIWLLQMVLENIIYCKGAIEKLEDLSLYQQEQILQAGTLNPAPGFLLQLTNTMAIMNECHAIDTLLLTASRLMDRNSSGPLPAGLCSVMSATEEEPPRELRENDPELLLHFMLRRNKLRNIEERLQKEREKQQEERVLVSRSTATDSPATMTEVEKDAVVEHDANNIEFVFENIEEIYSNMSDSEDSFSVGGGEDSFLSIW